MWPLQEEEGIIFGCSDAKNKQRKNLAGYQETFPSRKRFRLWNDLPREVPGAPSLELFQMRVGKALGNRLRMHPTPSLIPLLSTVAFHSPSKGRTSPSGLLMNIPAYTVVLGLQMHCYAQRVPFFCLYILVPGLGYSKAASALI